MIDCVVHAVGQGLLPLSFTYKKPGMVAFARVFIEIGQSLPTSAKVDVDDFFPSHQAVAAGLTRMLQSYVAS